MSRLGRVSVVACAVYALPALPGAPAVPFPAVARRGARSDAVALTFDDGPSPSGTPAVLDELDRLGLQATFFVVGEQARVLPELVAEIAHRGHELALHGDRHLPHLLRSPRAIWRDLERSRETVEQGAGRRVRALRAPYGAASLATLAFALRHELRLVAWSRWGRDWTASARPGSVAERLTDRVEGGDILLLHDSDAYAAPDSWRTTVGALPLVAARLVARGLDCVTVSALLDGASPA